MNNLGSCEKISIQNKQVNYWKEIEKNIAYELINLKGLVLLTHNSAEFIDLVEFLKNFRKGEFASVLYISLVRSYNYMKSALNFQPLDDKRMIFIDCVSGYAFPIDDKIDEAFYHKPPQNLFELKEILQFGIEKANPNIIILDSLSQFINFSQSDENDLSELCGFLRDLEKNKVSSNLQTILLVYDSKLGLIKNLPKKFTDHILKIEVLKDTKLGQL